MVLNFVNCLLTSTEMVVWFRPWFFWHISHVALSLLTHPCTQKVSPTWSWCMILDFYLQSKDYYIIFSPPHTKTSAHWIKILKCKTWKDKISERKGRKVITLVTTTEQAMKTNTDMDDYIILKAFCIIRELNNNLRSGRNYFLPAYMIRNPYNPTAKQT